MDTILTVPGGARALFVMAHGAGAGMRHPFLEEVARELSARRVATLRYQFPFMERGGRRVDPPEVAHQAVRAAVAAAAAPGLPLFAGGKSFGGRMTSQAQAAAPLPGVLGLAFLGFPLHPPDQPGRERGRHLADVRVPMLFLQGTRDEFAGLTHLRAQLAELGERARLVLIEDADHAFHVRKRKTGKTDRQVIGGLCDELALWIEEIIGS